MILNISDYEFKNIFDNQKLYLPIRWDGQDFVSTLDSLFHLYQCNIEEVNNKNDIHIPVGTIKKCCALIIKSLKSYLNGFPSVAFEHLQDLMTILMINPLELYHKNINELFESPDYHDPLNLFRVVGVSDNIPYGRSRVFHTPYNLRSKVSTSRYSIAGYPSLYLGTSIELCEEEVRLNPYDKFAITSLFKIERNLDYSDTEINVIELALKPQDFFEGNNLIDRRKRRRFSNNILNDVKIKKAYLLWYPLIAACSFIRVNKSDPFAVEYIIPQLLMQWIRSEVAKGNNDYDHLIGIRYFSCASERASDMGFNYVFPTSGKCDNNLPFCSVLMNAFKLTKPVYIHEFDDISQCECYLKRIPLDSVKY